MMRQEFKLFPGLNAEGDAVIDYTDMVFGANTKYLFGELNMGLTPFVVGGVTLHRLTAEKKVDKNLSEPTLEEAETKVENEFGLDGGAGVLYGIGTNLNLKGEAKFRSILDENVKFDQMVVMAGLALKL